MIAIIETFLNGNISDAQRRAKHRSFMKLVEAARDIGFEPLNAWNVAATIKGWQTWEEYCRHDYGMENLGRILSTQSR